MNNTQQLDDLKEIRQKILDARETLDHALRQVHFLIVAEMHKPYKKLDDPSHEGREV